MGIGEIRIQLYRLFEIGRSVFVVLLFAVNPSDIVIGRGVVWFYPKRFSIRFSSLHRIVPVSGRRNQVRKKLSRLAEVVRPG